MPDPQVLRARVRDGIDAICAQVNEALGGTRLKKLETVLGRLGRGGRLPHWYEVLRKKGSLPNLDGKTIGSVVEMLLVAVLETRTFSDYPGLRLRVNPARGVDLPDLQLGVKSPSKNFCTSEPFFSAYERLLGNEHDLLVLLTDYQTAKKNPPLRLRIIEQRYLKGSEVADRNLCRIAEKQRVWLVGENEAWARKVFRFLCYINQSDWRAKFLLKLVERLQEPKKLNALLADASEAFTKRNDDALKKDKAVMPENELEAITAISAIKPLHLGVIDAADNWVLETQKENARAPNDNEWERFLKSPLDGKIGMSLALQWRYNFGPLFRVGQTNDE